MSPGNMYFLVVFYIYFLVLQYTPEDVLQMTVKHERSSRERACCNSNRECIFLNETQSLYSTQNVHPDTLVNSLALLLTLRFPDCPSQRQYQTLQRTFRDHG